jgi:hyperosmotically inducible protein
MMKKIGNYLSAVLMALAVVTLVGCASTETYMDDSMITTKVKGAILNDPALDVNDISVETVKGTVQLSGFVKTQAEVDRAGVVANGVTGVKNVKNDLHVK